MAKWSADAGLDAALDYWTDAQRLVVCDGQPDDYADIENHALADVAVTGSDFTKADGDTGGRKVTVAAKSGIDVDANGTADHVVLVNDTAEELLYVTTISSQPVTMGNKIDLGAWTITISDPS